jgi:hypothetical protein
MFGEKLREKIILQLKIGCVVWGPTVCVEVILKYISHGYSMRGCDMD